MKLKSKIPLCLLSGGLLTGFVHALPPKICPTTMLESSDIWGMSVINYQALSKTFKHLHPKISSIINAVDKNDADELQHLLGDKRYCLCHYVNNFGDIEPLLCYAIKNQRTSKIIQLLAQHSEIADFRESATNDPEKKSALHWAAIKYNIEAITILLQEYRALTISRNIDNHDDKIDDIQKLKSHYYIDICDADGYTPLDYLLLEPFCDADQWNTIRFLLQKGATVNHCINDSGEKQTALFPAILHGSKYVKLLLENSSNSFEDTQTLNRFKQTPLMYAVTHGDVPDYNSTSAEQVVDEIEKIASLGTAETEKIYSSDEEIDDDEISTLLDANPTVIDWQDADGNTALHLAVLEQNLAVIETLAIKGHANINIRNNNGKTALDLAIENKYITISRYLNAIEKIRACELPPSSKRARIK